VTKGDSGDLGSEGVVVMDSLGMGLNTKGTKVDERILALGMGSERHVDGDEHGRNGR